MKKIFMVMLILLVGIQCVGCSSEASTPSYYGDFEVIGQHADAPLGDFAEEDFMTIIGSILSFSSESASCFGNDMSTLGQTVSSPSYVTLNMNEETFNQMTSLTFASIEFGGSEITQVAVENGIVFYVVNEDMLLANSLGSFFFLSRVTEE